MLSVGASLAIVFLVAPRPSLPTLKKAPVPSSTQPPEPIAPPPSGQPTPQQSPEPKEPSASKVSVPSATARLPLHADQLALTVESLKLGHGMLLVGESGIGKSVLAGQIGKEVSAAIVGTYDGSVKETLRQLALALECPLEDGETGKQLTIDQLKEELKANLVGSDTVVIADDAERWPASLQYWLERLRQSGVTLCLLANAPPRKGIFLNLLRLELKPVPDELIRTLMYQEASVLGTGIHPAKMATLVTKAGGNPGLARRMVREVAAGIDDPNALDSSQYVDIMPMLMAIGALCGAVRLIALGLGDRTVYIMAGIGFSCFVAIRYLRMMFPRDTRRFGR
jgi:hypothetical protein